MLLRAHVCIHSIQLDIAWVVLPEILCTRANRTLIDISSRNSKYDGGGGQYSKLSGTALHKINAVGYFAWQCLLSVLPQISGF